MDAGVIRRLRRPSTLRAVVVGVLAPVAATGIAAALDLTTTAAALIYVVSVVAAAGLGGLAAGLGASVLSFLGLNFYFTEPVHTLKVSQREDLLALVVFLLVAILVGSLLATALALRARAERREREARLFSTLSTRLLSGEPSEAVLREFARSLVDLFGLAGARVEVRDVRSVEVGDLDAGPAEVVPLMVGPAEVGRIVLVPDQKRAPFGDHERALIRTFGGQLALAVEGARLGEEAHRAGLEAEANQLRAALFSSVTHDLRTPLASIKAAVTSLLEEGVAFSEQERTELLRTILEETDRLSRLVANLLDLSRIRAGTLTPSKVPVPIGEVVESVVRRLRTVLGDRPVQIAIRENLPEVQADLLQVDQVLSNLLENAATYSPAGSEVVVSAARVGDGVQVRVVDRGPGIPPEDRDRVFEPFFRGDADGSGPGTGLGLAIAKAIVSVHGGRIWVEATPAGGTTMVFELPAGEAAR